MAIRTNLLYEPQAGQSAYASADTSKRHSRSRVRRRSISAAVTRPHEGGRRKEPRMNANARSSLNHKPALAKPVAHTPAVPPFPSALICVNLRITYFPLRLRVSARDLLAARKDHRVGKGRRKVWVAGEIDMLNPPGQLVGRARARRETAASRRRPATCCPDNESAGVPAARAEARSAGRCCGG